MMAKNEKNSNIQIHTHTQKKQSFSCGEIIPHIQLFHFWHPLFTYSRLQADVQTHSYLL